jgi:hypothetical protein
MIRTITFTPSNSIFRVDSIHRLLEYIVDTYDITFNRYNDKVRRMVYDKLNMLESCNLIQDKTSVYDMQRRIGEKCIIWLPDKNKYCCNKPNKQLKYMCNLHRKKEKFIIDILYYNSTLGRDLTKIVANYLDVSILTNYH